MGTYDVQQVCLNGHVITRSYNRKPEFRRKHCPHCGTETIHRCPSCNTEIRGEYHVQGAYGFSQLPPPEHCDNCGCTFPWSGRRRADGTLRDPIAALTNLCERFHSVAVQLRRRYADRLGFPLADEYDVQDLMKALLCIEFDDVRPEEYAPSHGGGSSRMDFLLKSERIVLETKMTRESLKAKQIGDQLIVDTARYKAHPDCKTLVCYVYDPLELLSNPAGLERDLSKSDGDLEVKVIVGPRRR